jgi:hypothetical protein
MLPIIWAGVAALGVAALLIMLNWTSITDAPHLINDFPADAWMMQHQAHALHQGTFPSLSLTASTTAFYPVFTFYGGTFFAFGGLIKLLVSSADTAETILTLLALAAAYGGWLWLARMAGVRSWQAHVPAILYVTAPYVSTNINVRQALAEQAAAAVIPLVLASGLSVLRADRLRAGPAAALAVSTVAFGGTHNLTLLWGATILSIAALAVVAGVPQARRLVTKRGVLRVLAIMVPAMAVNAWYLLPDIAYHADTVIFSRLDEWKQVLKGPHPEFGAEYLFALGRPGVSPNAGLVVTLPVLAIAWIVIAALATRAQWRGTWGRMLGVLTLLTIGVFLVMTHPRWILALPDAWQMIQFSYRLLTFVLFGICGAIIVALVLVNRSPHRWLALLLLPIVVFSIVGVAIQRHDAPRSPDAVTADIDTYGSFSIGDYADGSLPKRQPPQDARVLNLVRANVVDGEIEATAGPGEIIYTNLMTPSKLLDIQGARVIGRWPASSIVVGWQPRWGLVLQVDRDAPAGNAPIVIRQARSLPVVGGRIISLLGLLGLAANAAVIARAAFRRRQARLAT